VPDSSNTPPPSSNRTCRFPASGSHASARQAPRARNAQNVVATLGSQWGNVLTQPKGQERVRRGTCVQAAFLTSYRSMLAFRPLHSTGVSRFLATTSLSDSRIRHTHGYAFPHALGSSPTTCAGLPGSSADLSTRAVPSHPGESDDCTHPLLLRRWQASGSLAPWPLSLCVTRPNRVRLRYGSRVRLTRLRSFDYSSCARLAIC